jgi:hypothetical protein
MGIAHRLQFGNEGTKNTKGAKGAKDTKGAKGTKIQQAFVVTVQPHPSPSGFAAAAAGLGPKGLRPEGGGGGVRKPE